MAVAICPVTCKPPYCQLFVVTDYSVPFWLKYSYRFALWGLKNIFFLLAVEQIICIMVLISGNVPSSVVLTGFQVMSWVFFTWAVTLSVSEVYRVYLQFFAVIYFCFYGILYLPWLQTLVYLSNQMISSLPPF